MVNLIPRIHILQAIVGRGVYSSHTRKAHLWKGFLCGLAQMNAIDIAAFTILSVNSVLSTPLSNIAFADLEAAGICKSDLSLIP